MKPVFDSKRHFESLGKVSISMAYQMCGTRKNCAVTTIWFCLTYCHSNCPDIASFAPGGGCYINDMETFSMMYAMMTNTEKRKLSKSNFGYACRQNLQNHFVLIWNNNGKYYFFHEHFLPTYPDSQVLTYQIVSRLILPWKKSLAPEMAKNAKMIMLDDDF